MKQLKTAFLWVMSWTWGALMTSIGAITALFLLVTAHRPKLFHGLVYFEVGKNWGGFNCGPFFFVCSNHSLHTKQHESGHGLQNIMLGPFTPFVICIPSAIRYWYREIVVRTGKKKVSELPSYDSIWFEGWATRLGEKYFW